MVTGTADTACTSIGKGHRDLLLASNLRSRRLYRLARRFDRAHPRATGASIRSEITTLTRTGTI
jgi:hypothetical protein